MWIARPKCTLHNIWTIAFTELIFLAFAKLFNDFPALKSTFSPPLSKSNDPSSLASHHLTPCSNKSPKAVQIQTAKSLIGSILLSSPFNPRLPRSPGPIIAANSQILGSFGVRFVRLFDNNPNPPESAAACQMTPHRHRDFGSLLAGQKVLKLAPLWLSDNMITSVPN